MENLNNTDDKKKFEINLKKYFLKIDVISNLFELAKINGFNLWIVGGAIRDFFIGKEIKDVDFASDLDPNQLIKILKKINIKIDINYLNFGCIILLINNQKFTITSLREDFDQDGRYTKICFTKSLKKDSFRRDLTFNSLYLSADGILIDYHNGFNDLKLSRLVFIGKIEKKCIEDNLRIIRLIRFYSIFENPIICLRYMNYLSKNNFLIKNISKNKINYEIHQMLNNKYLINSINLIKQLKMEKYFSNQIDFDELSVISKKGNINPSN